jgi:peptidoglycan/xylan/chitin deacetylase (PgdA/CDA1 family)
VNEVRVWRRADQSSPRVAITVDDCDDPEAWAAILDVLRRHRAPATFFALGMRVEEHPGLARRTVREGHGIGSHGFDHARLTLLGPEEVRARLEKEARVWERVGGVATGDLRPPYGDWDRSTRLAAAAAGYRRVILWDVDPEDWRVPGPAEVARRVLGAVRAGSIVVLHAVPDTAQALEVILVGLRSRGLEPVTVEELLSGMPGASPG